MVAKDGKHTIPFEELQRARDEAKYWQAQAEEASRIAQQSQSEQPHNPTAAVDLKQLRRELREAMLLDDDARIDELEAQIDEEISRKAEAKAIQVLEQQAAQAEERAISATAESLIKTYPDLDHTKPGANLEAIATVQALSAMYVNRDLLALRRWWTLLIGWPSSMGWERRRKLTFRMKPRWRRRKKLSHRPAQRQRCRQAFRQFLRRNPASR